ncbi:MAG TPA: phosphatase PAP2 family protein [Xanthobacteraceae bacterium]|nr:phosphatase PAP2 family protein [Xanthobacteraceae bacterium]
MTGAGDLQVRASQPGLLARTAANLAEWMTALARPPRMARRPVWFPLGRLALGAAFTILAVAGAMLLVDSWAVAHRGSLPVWLVATLAVVSDLGKSGWVLVPVALMLVTIAAVGSPALGRTAHGVLTSLAVRLGFVFLAVGIPGLFVTIIKRLIGRARPLRVEGSDLHFAPFSWSVDFASLPSGHSTTAFATAVALGALLPRGRWLFFFLAALIALSRVVVGAHYPSDVIAGAVVGSFGALLVRTWFAARGLGFGITLDGSVRVFPRPSLRRLQAVARQVAGQ